MMRTRTKARLLAIFTASLIWSMLSIARLNPGTAGHRDLSNPAEDKIFFLYAQHGGLLLVFSIVWWGIFFGLYELLALAIYKFLRWLGHER